MNIGTQIAGRNINNYSGKTTVIGRQTPFDVLFGECEKTSHNVVNPQGQLHTAFCSKCGCVICIDDDDRAIRQMK